MKKLLLAMIVTVVTAGMVASAASAEPGKGRGTTKCTILHNAGENGKVVEITVGLPAVRAHVANHNDTLASSETDAECLLAAGATPLEDGAGTPALVTNVAGTLSTKNGDPVLKTTSGDTMKLKAKSAKSEKRLEALAKKGERVKVTGKKSGNTLEISQLKPIKGKKK